MNGPFDPLTVWCPHCGAGPFDECWGPVEHAERFAAAEGVDQIEWWPEPSAERCEELAAMPYDEYLRSPEWKERREIMRVRAGYRCQDCGGTQRLQVHHRTYERRGFEWPSDLIVVCDPCHINCHPDKRLEGASVSYGAYVQACIDERRKRTIGNQTWDYAAVKYANDNFPDYPEDRVIEALREMRWPDRPVTVGEVLKRLRETVTSEEQRAWLEEATA